MRARPPAGPASAAALALCLLAVAACSGGGSKKFIPPPPPSIAKITTAPPGSDYTGVVLNPVEGRQKEEPVKVLGGEASLGGILLGPDGPVGGATVRLERFVGDAVGRLDVTSNADGTWKAPQPPRPPTVATVPTVPLLPGQAPTLPPTTPPPPPPSVTRPPTGPQGILGGRYRVRAWKSPDLALTTPQILFLEGKENKQLPLQLSRYTGTNVTSITSPDPPVVGAPLTLTAVVTSASVDGDGVVRSVPAAGVSVVLTVGPGFTFTGGPAVTNAQGRAAFQLRCESVGQSQVEVTVNQTEAFSLQVRSCVAPPPTTVTTQPAFDPSFPSTTSPFGTAPTTSLGGPGNSPGRP